MKIKAKLGELLPAGEVGAGRGNKIDQQMVDFNKKTVYAYRKLAKHKDKLSDILEDVPKNSKVAFSDPDYQPPSLSDFGTSSKIRQSMRRSLPKTALPSEPPRWLQSLAKMPRKVTR